MDQEEGVHVKYPTSNDIFQEYSMCTIQKYPKMFEVI